jgi:TRAP-type C4-dicarboxylate transport system permease small subunit
MFFAQRTRQRILLALVVCATYVGFSAVLAWAFPKGPTHLGSLTRWLLGIPVVLGVYAALEIAGERFLSLAIWSRMPPVLRSVVLVCCIAAVAAFAIAASNWTHGAGAP